MKPTEIRSVKGDAPKSNNSLKTLLMLEPCQKKKKQIQIVSRNSTITRPSAKIN